MNESWPDPVRVHEYSQTVDCRIGEGPHGSDFACDPERVAAGDCYHTPWGGPVAAAAGIECVRPAWSTMLDVGGAPPGLLVLNLTWTEGEWVAWNSSGLSGDSWEFWLCWMWIADRPDNQPPIPLCKAADHGRNGAARLLYLTLQLSSPMVYAPEATWEAFLMLGVRPQRVEDVTFTLAIDVYPGVWLPGFV